MVDHSSRRANKVKRWLLVTGIVAVGVLDVAVTTYLTNGDATDMTSSSVAKVDLRTKPAQTQTNESSAVPYSDIDTEPAVTSNDDQSAYTNVVGSRRESSRRRFRNVREAKYRSVTVNEVSELDCRTVAYPFVGTYYYVRVTDNVGCITTNVSRSRSDRLIARSRPADGKPRG